MKSKLSKVLWDVHKRLIYCLLGLTLVTHANAGGPLTNHLSVNAEWPVTGTVTDENGNAITGVTVLIKGTNKGTSTDESGKFSVKAIDGNDTLVFSIIGYVQKEIAINKRKVVNISLTSSIKSLNDVVIVGYGTQKKATVTGAISAMNTKEVVEAPQANISNYLAGRLSGVLAQQQNGQPGQDQSVIRIRGAGTFSGSADPLIMVDGIEAQNYNNIDPNEIETISVLKDASATAVYGVRGANGVMLITTKRGKRGKPQVSFTANYGITQFANLRKGMNSYDYARTFNEARKYDSYISGGYTPRFTDEDIEHFRTGDDPIFHPNTDWTSTILKKNSSQFQTNLNISGGTDKVRYFISGGYYDQGGLFKNTDLVPGYDVQLKYKRYNFRSNFDFDITKRLSANINVSSQLEQLNGPFQDIGYIMLAIFAAPPTVSPGIIDGKVINLNAAALNPSPFNRLLGSAGFQKTFKNYLDGSVRLNYKLDFITQGLSTHGTVSYQNYNAQSTTYSRDLVTYRPNELPDNSIVYIPSGVDNPLRSGESIAKRRKNYFEVGLDYARRFGDHNFTGLVMYNQSKLFDPTLQFQIPHAYQGFVGRITYDYKSRYLAEFDAGYNGTENFAKDKRFGFFPAYSLGWVASEESFFPKNKILSFLKFRGSYGEVGNDQIGGDRFLYRPSSYQYTGGYYFGDISSYNYYPGSMEAKIGNPDLTWERAKKLDVGADLRFLKDKIAVTVDWFQENRDNILANRGTVPAYVGATLPAYNLGSMKNSGVDGSITYKDNIGKFKYFVSANFTYAHNVIEFMDESKWPYAYQSRTGKRAGQFFGLVADGFYNTWDEVNEAKRPKSAWNNNRIMPGDVKYKDINGDGIINNDDQVPIGYSNFPEQVYGFTVGGEFKGFDLSVFFQGANHVSLRSSKKSTRGWQEDGVAADYLRDLSWSEERYEKGLPIEFPHYSADANLQGNNYQPSTLWIRDASYMRLKTAMLGYTFNGAFLKKAGISTAHIYVSGNNLVTWSHVLPGENPESGSQDDGGNEPYPVTRTYNVGLNLTF